ncbi:MAG TPA: hypothetical protein H9822_10210 [Candidatus Yaniella excrementavium]|nr:hypothetical protein [Candidatus Yaniella excrementavium]
MSWPSQRSAQVVMSTRLAIRALKAWRARQVIAAVVAALLVALVIGFATVLIPNELFTRDIPPTWWDHPVWIITSALSGILIATYVRPDTSAAPETTAAGTSANAQYDSARQERSGKIGMLGGFLAWFAVGCPVCNKIALLILGYSGALTWFAPFQPVLAVSAMLLTGVAVIWRLKGQVACTMPKQPSKDRSKNLARSSS